MNKIKLQNNVLTTIKIAETIFMVLMIVFTLLPNWGGYSVGNFDDPNFRFIRTSFINYDAVLGSIVIIAGVAIIITIWTKLPIVSLISGLFQFFPILYVFVKIPRPGAFETGIAHFVVSILSLVILGLLVIDSKNKKGISE